MGSGFGGLGFGGLGVWRCEVWRVWGLGCAFWGGLGSGGFGVWGLDFGGLGFGGLGVWRSEVWTFGLWLFEKGDLVKKARDCTLGRPRQRRDCVAKRFALGANCVVEP